MTNSPKNTYKYLSTINTAEDFRALPDSAMTELAAEIRSFLVDCVKEHGGHLASNLGVVELTMAIHRVFETPYDHVIFDVGHQSYVHKILTGRRAMMDTLRTPGGLSGFMKRSESEHDCFGSGHSSTSISSALGFAVSDSLNGSNAYSVAVIGDGAYTGGMVHEALNNCKKDLKLIIIINENEMSISKNTGRFANLLSKLRTKPGYFKTKRATGKILKKIPWVGTHLFRAVRDAKIFFKSAIYGSNYFENMGLTYLGPIDGNDFFATERLLRQAKELGESVIVHVKTKKGKGYLPAEEAPDKYHGISPNAPKESAKTNFSAEMGAYLSKLAEDDSKICAITAAMCDGTGLNAFKDAHKERFFDVGIAEEHAVTFAAGLAANGMRPFVCIYSSFLQRSYDNIVHDVALQELPVIFCVDRAGLSAGDGATHHGIFDVAFLSQIPNVTIFTPATFDTLRLSIDTAMTYSTPCAIRYPNGSEDKRVVKVFYGDVAPQSLGIRCNFEKADCPEVIFVTHGRMASAVLDASDILEKEHSVRCGVILLEMLKPYDSIADKIISVLPEGDAKIVFVEEEIRNGGMGVSLYDKLRDTKVMKNKQVKILALDDSFAVPDKDMTVFDAAGVSVKDIVNSAL